MQADRQGGQKSIEFIGCHGFRLRAAWGTVQWVGLPASMNRATDLARGDKLTGLQTSASYHEQ